MAPRWSPAWAKGEAEASPALGETATFDYNNFTTTETPSEGILDMSNATVPFNDSSTPTPAVPEQTTTLDSTPTNTVPRRQSVSHAQFEVSCEGIPWLRFGMKKLNMTGLTRCKKEVIVRAVTHRMLQVGATTQQISDDEDEYKNACDDFKTFLEDEKERSLAGLKPASTLEAEKIRKRVKEALSIYKKARVAVKVNEVICTDGNVGESRLEWAPESKTFWR